MGSESATPGRTPQQLRQAITRPLARLWGAGAWRVTRLGGDASSRVYHRVRALDDSQRSAIVMELGPDPLRSDEAVGTERPQELPFVDVQRFLASGGIDVPEIYEYLRADGLLLLEDLGDCTLEAEVGKADAQRSRALYERAVDGLVDMQRHAARVSSPTVCICFRRRFERSLLRWELDHFREWLLEADRGIALADAEATALAEAFDRLADTLAALPTGWVHRDYQSRNIMVQQQTDGSPRLRVIDFQDALIGPLVYDLVGLLRDSYVDLGSSLVEQLLQRYVRVAQPSVAAEDLVEMFWLQTVQRKLKDAGRFVFIDRVRGNDSFLKHIPLSLRYVGEALARLPGLAPLAEVLGRHLPELAG